LGEAQANVLPMSFPVVTYWTWKRCWNEPFKCGIPL